ncbi:DUF4328 domain-containing protein [Kiloniella antarctica]|uniref:DUF4328 domain-containing protein n=1 Tax=Kiloniella antarctica TaxID=1550907 RepID=A0ABW5BK78_9PROT
MAVFFIPVTNIWKPYQIPAEIWKVSKFGSNHKRTDTSPLTLKLWRVFWGVDSVFFQVSYNITDRAVETNELINADRIFFSSNIVSIIAILLTIKMVKEIDYLQANQGSHISEVFA